LDDFSDFSRLSKKIGEHSFECPARPFLQLQNALGQQPNCTQIGKKKLLDDFFNDFGHLNPI
jgi:hypothetical protein